MAQASVSSTHKGLEVWPQAGFPVPRWYPPRWRGEAGCWTETQPHLHPRDTQMCTRSLGPGAAGSQDNEVKVSGSFQGMGYLLIFRHWFSAKEGILENSTRTPLARVTLCLPGYAEFSLHHSVLPPDPGPAHTSCMKETGPSQTNS